MLIATLKESELTAKVRNRSSSKNVPLVHRMAPTGFPLSRWPSRRPSTRILVDGLLEGQRLSGKPVGAILCTNGTFFDEDLFRTFAVNSDSFSVAISIDGSQENHDKHRP